MSLKKARWIGLAVVACLAMTLPLAGSPAGADVAAKGKAKVVRVADDFFSPDSTGVGRGRVITWVWARGNENAHNVRLRGAPSGVSKRRFRAPRRRARVRFARRVRKPGRYVFVCSFHAPEMRLVLRVHR